MKEWFVDFWNLELYSSADQSIYLNQIIIALVIIVVGVLLSKFVSVLAGKRLAKRLNRSTAYFIQKLTHYFLLVVIVLMALPIAGIPITVFTVIGGALAIGVGFGAQNLFNNLISGIILMLEQPIRVGDIVELDDAQGRVEDIGNRCVRIRRTDGVDVIMPNSYFLEQPVVNWTLFDANLRGSVSVGVAYGSPTRKVRELIEKAVSGHSKVQPDPKPEILFEEFGDNSLLFTALFWTKVSRPMDLRRIQSDIRYEIDDLFREADITISFPQRDIHLDTLKPLEVRIQKEQ